VPAISIEHSSLPWGLTVVDLVQYLLDHPTLNVNDVLRHILLDPRSPRGTQSDYANLSSALRTAQDVLRNIAQRCVTMMRPVYDIQDRNDPTSAQVEDSITFMLDAQAFEDGDTCVRGGFPDARTCQPARG